MLSSKCSRLYVLRLGRCIKVAVIARERQMNQIAIAQPKRTFFRCAAPLLPGDGRAAAKASSAYSLVIYGRRAGADEHSLLGDRGQGLREDGHAEKGREGGSTDRVAMGNY